MDTSNNIYQDEEDDCGDCGNCPHCNMSQKILMDEENKANAMKKILTEKKLKTEKKSINNNVDNI